jgi:hypothetical protein
MHALCPSSGIIRERRPGQGEHAANLHASTYAQPNLEHLHTYPSLLSLPKQPSSLSRHLSILEQPHGCIPPLSSLCCSRSRGQQPSAPLQPFLSPSTNLQCTITLPAARRPPTVDERVAPDTATLAAPRSRPSVYGCPVVDKETSSTTPAHGQALDRPLLCARYRAPARDFRRTAGGSDWTRPCTSVPRAPDALLVPKTLPAPQTRSHAAQLVQSTAATLSLARARAQSTMRRRRRV